LGTKVCTKLVLRIGIQYQILPHLKSHSENSNVLPHPNIHKCTLRSPDKTTHNQVDHILIAGRRQSSILDVRPFRVTDCDTNQYLVVAEVRVRLAVNKQRSRKFLTQMFNLKKLNDLKGKEKYHGEDSNRFRLSKVWTLRGKLIVLGN
jgi:hypothetical protein